ncbi:MAG: V-type ATPase subunit [Clostridiales bacterium]|nr:V-type ATPase subunit [Clostridiales bacterium]
MSEQAYTYAVSRIRSKELTLLDGAFYERLITSPSVEDCHRQLEERGWGSLSEEREKTWQLLQELVGDADDWNVFLLPQDYHNLKAAVKQVCTQSGGESVYLPAGRVDPDLIRDAVQRQEFSLLPEPMREPAQRAYEALLHTRDGQLCDTLVDRAALDAILQAGNASQSAFIQQYAEWTVATADIKIALRAYHTHKPDSFYEEALAPCQSLDTTRLAEAARRGIDALAEYLALTDYAEAVDAIRQSVAAFDRWCARRMAELVAAQRHNPFTIAPLAAYWLAREQELQIVRMILSGKAHAMPQDAIREKVRELYV